MNFAVGIPRLNETDLLIEATIAIASSSISAARLFIVDNGAQSLDLGPFPHDNAWSCVVRPHRNLGVAGSWNLIRTLSAPLPTILINADCTVAPDTFERMLAEPGPAIVCAYGFACVRIDDEVWRAVGSFDEEFYPGYWEDADYERRCRLAGVRVIRWSDEPREVVAPGRERSSAGIVHGKHDPQGYQGWRGDKLRWFHECIEANHRRYVAKWGGELGSEAFSIPFDGAPDPGRATEAPPP